MEILIGIIVILLSIVICFLPKVSNVPARLDNKTGYLILTYGIKYKRIIFCYTAIVAYFVYVLLYPFLLQNTFFSYTLLLVSFWLIIDCIYRWILANKFRIEITEDSMIVYQPFKKVNTIQWKDIRRISRGKALIKIFDCNGIKVSFLTCIDGYNNLNAKYIAPDNYETGDRFRSTD